MPSQQAAEKTVKAVFQKLSAEAWGHSVADLLTELSEHISVPQELIDGALELDKADIPARYPNAHPPGGIVLFDAGDPVLTAARCDSAFAADG